MSGLNDEHQETRRVAKGQGRPSGWIDGVAYEVVRLDEELFSLPFDKGKTAYETLRRYDHHIAQTLKGDAFEGYKYGAERCTNIMFAKYTGTQVVYATLS